MIFEGASTYVKTGRNLDEARKLLRRYLQAPITSNDPPKSEAETDAFAAVADFAPAMMWLSQADGCRTFFNSTWLASSPSSRPPEANSSAAADRRRRLWATPANGPI